MSSSTSNSDALNPVSPLGREAAAAPALRPANKIAPTVTATGPAKKATPAATATESVQKTAITAPAAEPAKRAASTAPSAKPDQAESAAGIARGRRQAIRRLGWGALVAFALLGLLDAYVFRDPAFYDLGNKNGARGGFIGQFAHIERAFEAQGGENIEYAIFGDSQSIDALRPDVMAEALGVPADRIFNFSVSGGKPTDNLYLYRIYAKKMPNLKKAIYVVNEHQLNNADAGDDTKFKFHATLRQRLKALDRDNYGELLAGWALRSFGLRTEWTALFDRYRAGTWPPEEEAMFPGGIEPLRWADPKTKTPEYAVEVADRWFRGWQPEGVYTEALKELLEALRERGVETVVLQIPRTPWFEEAVAEKYAAERDEYLQKVSEAAAANGAVFEVVAAEDAGLAEDNFRDVNHMNPDGAEAFSRYAAGRWWE